MFTVTIEGFDELNAHWERAQRTFASDLVSGTTRALRAGHVAARAAAPVKTSELQKSIEGRVISVSATAIEGELVATAPHAQYVSEGTKPHEIRPKRTGMVSSRLNAKKSAKQAKFLAFEVGGRLVFAKKVNHPGTKPNGFFEVDGRRALEGTFYRETDAAVERLVSEMNG
ncbi:MAG: hypothetical protein HOW73_20560 [Polyangiaceae bacterium]|nr:hypothetical protein [Polyangiaceae bacterium]